MGSGSTYFLNTLASATGTFLAFVVEVALILIALTTVRQRRPDASTLFVIGGVLLLIPTLGWSLFTMVAGPMLGGGGSGGLVTVYGLVSLFLTLVRTAGWGAILFGIIKLASPSGAVPRDPTRYG